MKVNEWEQDLGFRNNTISKNHFAENSNELFLYSNLEELVLHPEDIKSFINRFLNIEIPRLKILESYSNGNNYGIMNRKSRNNKDRADYRVAHNFGGYISKINTGYLFGIPVKIINKLEENSINENERNLLNEIKINNNLDDLNASLGYDCSVFGRAYELHYRNNRDEDRIVKSSVYETFIIYDNTVEKKPLMGIRCPSYRKGNKLILNIELYTKDKVYYCKETPINKIDIIIDEEKTKDNIRNKIQIIEWNNNEKRTGDFEQVISLIDLYDYSQADTANYMSDFNEAMLVISGDLNSSEVNFDKDANLLVLESGMNASGGSSPINAGYIYKTYDVAGTEAYKKRLETDIHKFTLTPSLDDESFSSVASGEAQKYKLWGVEQLRSTKEQYYKKAIIQRYELINSIKSKISEFYINTKDLQIEFTENVPKNYWEEVKAFISAGGELSKSTLISLLSWVDDVKGELTKLELENESEEIKDVELKNIDIEKYLNGQENE